MKKIIFINLAVITALIASSCSTSNSVVSNRLISKRKYTKGFHFNKKENYKVSEEENVAAIEEVEENYVISTNENSYPEVYASTNDGLSDEITSSQPTINVEETINNDSQRRDVKTNDSKIETTSSKKDIRAEYKAIRKTVKESKNTSAPAESGAMLILLVILAIIIPPLAVFLVDGASTRFWIDLILAILGWGVGFWLLGGLGWLCGLAAIIYALLIVLGAI